ncbi:MAG: Gfo/Idh/MocA family oxidoreductase, partial [Desulfomonilaceae bacterium]
FVRWTEQRNFEAALELLASNRLIVEPLISHRFKFEEATKAYELLGGPEQSLGMLLTYGQQETAESDLLKKTVNLSEIKANASNISRRKGSEKTEPIVGVIGAGNYGLRTFLPALRSTGAKLKILSTSTGVSGAYAGKKFGFSYATTDTSSIFTDPEINTVFVLTRHNTHSSLVCEALKFGKNVYVEKPLAIFPEQVKTVEAAYLSSREHKNPPIVMIGFNRRFAPHIQKIKGLLKGIKEPISIIITVNAGEVPPGDWTQDPMVGGGRIIGEGCHFVDLLYYLTGSKPTSLCSTKIGSAPGIFVTDDKMTFTIKFENGSFGTVHYLANGAKSFPKERIEIFCGERILQMDNFQLLKGFDWPGFKKTSLWKQDKGHKESITRFLDAVTNHCGSPIPFEQIVNITNTTFDIIKAASNE